MTEQNSELVERIQLLVSADALWSSPESYIPIQEVEQMDIAVPATTANSIIALVEVDVAARLLTEEALGAAFFAADLDVEGPGVYTVGMDTMAMMKAALSHIGIESEATDAS